MSAPVLGTWGQLLSSQFNLPYMGHLRSFLKKEKSCGKIVYPRSCDCFNAFNFTPFEDVRVVILGQDPYHGSGQAHGLSFSVPIGVPIPPSLKNIFKELKQDVGIEAPNHGCLVDWAMQGVLLLNSVLSVEHACAGSHRNQGWEMFTDYAISLLNEHKQGVVFVLWGAYAKSKCDLIDQSKHCVIASTHPSPLSAHNGFFGSKPFSKINDYLLQSPIEWKID